MVPFGETVLAWRLARGMTQAELATAARVSRPNLSAIERGERDVTLRTLRALALALDVRPGVLADGVTPRESGGTLSRAAMERIATAAAAGTTPSDRRELALATWLRTAMAAGATAGGKPARNGTSAADRAFFLLKTSEGSETVTSLVNRVAERRHK